MRYMPRKLQSSKTKKTAGKGLSLKKQVQERLLRHCRGSGEYTFDNALVKTISQKVGFRNPFDATKIDSTDKLAPALQKKDFFILHLGEGRHRFVQGISKGYHQFEPIPENAVCEWPYKRSLLNEYDTSESNILSVAFNQKITHHFLYGNENSDAKVYQSRRTNRSMSYRVGKEEISTSGLQMEIDQTLERKGVVTLIEAKNGFPADFAIYQIYTPFLHFALLKKEKNLPIREINCCYLLRKKRGGNSVLRMYLYTFSDEGDMTSLQLKQCAEYRLIKQ